MSAQKRERYRTTVDRRSDGRILMAREWMFRPDEWKALYTFRITSFDAIPEQCPDWVRSFAKQVEVIA